MGEEHRKRARAHRGDGLLPPGGDDRHDDGTHRRRRRLLASFGAAVLVLLVLVAGGLWWATDRYAGNVARISDVFAEIPEAARPAPASPTQPGVDGEPVTFLLAGADSRESTPDGQAPAGRADAIMLLRLTADRERAQVVSINRDSWVDIPGRGPNKINAAYAFGGPALLVQTVEQLTGVRVDHVAVIDFEGLAQVTDALGGVEVEVAETTSNGGFTFQAGRNTITGENARWYLGQRYGLAGGDFDRVKRQQQFLQAILDELISSETFSDPGKLDAALRAMGDAVAVDSELGNAEMVRLAYSMRNLRQENVDFFTTPDNGTGMEGPASVVYINDVAAEEMWEYLRTDSLGENAESFAEWALGDEAPR